MEILPGIITGMIMAFTLSLDDFVISYFTQGSGFQTLPIRIYNMTKKTVTPKMYALATIIFFVILALLLLTNLVDEDDTQRIRDARRATRAGKPARAKRSGSGRRPVRAALGILPAAALRIAGISIYGSRQETRVLNVYNWGEYISNGSDDSEDVVSDFEKLTGIKVNYTTFDSNESMYAKLKSGAANYDVIVPSDYMAAKMIAEGMLMPLNYDNIPNFQNIDEEYRNADYDPENAYTVPYMLCTTGIIYNTTMVDKAPTSWADLWDPQYAGNILMFNNSRDAYAIAAFKAGKSINPDSTEEVDEVVEELTAQKPLVQAYVMDEIFDKMIGGEAAIGVYYSGDAITMIDDNPDLAWVFPEEGSVLSVDCMAVPAASEHKEAAEMIINIMCETYIGKANSE